MSVQAAAASNVRRIAFSFLLLMVARCLVVSNIDPASNSLVHEDPPVRGGNWKLETVKPEYKSDGSLKELKALLLSDMNWKEPLLSTKAIMLQIRELFHIIGISVSPFSEIDRKMTSYRHAIGGIWGSLRRAIRLLNLGPISVKDTLIGRNASEIENQIKSALKAKLDEMNGLLDKSWKGAFELAKVFDNIRKETKNLGSKAKSVQSAAALLESLDAKIVQAKEFCFNFHKTLNYLYVSRQIVLFYAREQYLSVSQKLQKSPISQEQLNLTTQLMEDSVLNIDRVFLTLDSIVSSYTNVYDSLHEDMMKIPGSGGLSEEGRVKLAFDKEQAVKDVETSSQYWDNAFESV